MRRADTEWKSPTIYKDGYMCVCLRAVVEEADVLAVTIADERKAATANNEPPPEYDAVWDPFRAESSVAWCGWCLC